MTTFFKSVVEIDYSSNAPSYADGQTPRITMLEPCHTKRKEHEVHPRSNIFFHILSGLHIPAHGLGSLNMRDQSSKCASNLLTISLILTDKTASLIYYQVKVSFINALLYSLYMGMHAVWTELA